MGMGTRIALGTAAGISQRGGQGREGRCGRGEKGGAIVNWSSCSALDVASSVDMVMADSQNRNNGEEPLCWVGRQPLQPPAL